MGLNVLLFIVFQIAVEPWRRRRLVKGFEEKVMEALERETSVLKTAGAGTAIQEPESGVKRQEEVVIPLTADRAGHTCNISAVD